MFCTNILCTSRNAETVSKLTWVCRQSYRLPQGVPYHRLAWSKMGLWQNNWVSYHLDCLWTGFPLTLLGSLLLKFPTIQAVIMCFPLSTVHRLTGREYHIALKHVSNDMKTYKNPALKAQSGPVCSGLKPFSALKPQTSPFPKPATKKEADCTWTEGQEVGSGELKIPELGEEGVSVCASQ
jgi:hypothetical protein